MQDPPAERPATTWLFRLSLAAILVLAIFLRWSAAHQGLPYMKVYDEAQTMRASLGMLQRGDFNPGFFHYGSLIIYVGYLTEWATCLFLTGQPTASPEALDTVADVQLGQPGFAWFISHPSLLLHSRFAVAALGSATVAVTAAIGFRLIGTRGALIAALCLTLAPPHVTYSGVYGVDAPVAFFVAMCVLGAIEFTLHGDLRWWGTSLLCAGLAASCKYNAGLVALVPVLAWAQSRAEGRPHADPWLLLSAPVIPAVGFLGTTPYALLDAPRFLADAGWEIRHYRVLGHTGFDATPGVDHLVAILLDLGANTLWWPACLAGFVWLGARTWRRLWFVWAFPCMHLVLMSSMVVNQHRNHVVLYVFISLAAAVTTVTLADWLEERPVAFKRGALQLPWLVWTAVGLAAAVGAARADLAPEGRTAAVLGIPANARVVGVPKELRVHPLDLRGLDVEVQEAPLHELLCRGGLDGILVPEAFFARRDHEEAERLNALLDVEPDAVAGTWPPPNGHMLVDHVEGQPVVSFRADLSGQRCSLALAELDMSRPFPVKDDRMLVNWNGWVRTSSQLAKAVVWTLSGTDAGGQTAKARLTAISGDNVLTTVDVAAGAQPTPMRLEVADEGPIVFQLQFLNDAVVDGADRNLVIHAVEVIAR